MMRFFFLLLRCSLVAIQSKIASAKYCLLVNRAFILSWSHFINLLRSRRATFSSSMSKILLITLLSNQHDFAHF
ncbi:hypothetical protein JCM18904_732 [Vibrio sp. JCM 18904]|nr:hypothetical protein JCM18904_732 [Vibrio sp. JCM 18904]